MRRVVVTGMGGVSALGNDWDSIETAFRAGTSAVRYMTEWDRFEDMSTRLAAPCDAFAPPERWTRKQLRGMGRVSQLAVRAAELALANGGLAGNALLSDGQMGVACGSCIGSTPDLAHFARLLIDSDGSGVNANSYIRMMPHTAAANIGIFFGMKGRVIPTNSACTSGSQAIGYAYEAILHGSQTRMLAGGAEELCPTQAKAFDTLYATSRRNEEPKRTPRPYDAERDGLVVGEGAAFLVLEELEAALARGASIHAEIIGYSTNSDGTHVTRPEESTMRAVMENALRTARITADQVDYVNGHGTATMHGDQAESRATSAVFGPDMPISSQKSFLGHTLGACGALEAWFSIEMMNRRWFAPTLNLEKADPECAPLDYIRETGREIDADIVVSNNFAFGGINTSLVLKRYA
ncbi:MAG TPA: beta-ketoacyl-ACP synthase [Steroidobacteraceae bacterium]|nr:beta-ketoacyl-ACP synthase [Steroidobacteraceae bacterium]